MSQLLWFTHLDLEVPADQLGQLGAVELRVERGRFVLTWDDGVANEWTETFALPEHAFARVAALLHSARTGHLFKDDSVGFTNRANAFLASVVGDGVA